MFTQIELRDIETEGVLQSNEFTIKANGKAFKVLIDGLYSDKIRSIIRELWSNAYDSHIAAGKRDVPFDCHLPTVWEPEFRVRDYGISLSHADVMHLYTTVFESTKEDTNEQVGKLGLGSKSPFAYTDTFTVTTWRDGKKHVYSAYIGEKYVPTIALLAVEDTDEPQGLEVAFPAQTDDISAFKDAARMVAYGFDILPNISGATLPADDREVLYSGEGWQLYAGPNGAQARQGCVVYPIDPYMVTGADERQRKLMRTSLVIDFPVGDLEIAASREGLGYTPETSRNIITQLQRIADEIRTQIFSNEFASIRTYWEANNYYASRCATADSYIKSIIDELSFRTRPLKSQWYVSDPAIRKIDSEVARGFRTRNKGGWDGTQTFYAAPSKQVVVFQDASKKITRVKERLKHFYQTTPGLRDNRYDLVIVRGVPGSIALKRALITLGRPPITANVADMPLPPKVEKPERKRVQLKKFRPTNYVSVWAETTIAVNSGGLYVPLDRFMPQMEVNGELVDSSNEAVRNALAALIALGMVPEDVIVYGVPKTLRHVTRKHKMWKCLWDVVKDTLSIGFDQQQIERHNIVQQAVGEIHSHNVGRLCKRWMDECRHPGGLMFSLMIHYSRIIGEDRALRHHAHYLQLSQLFPNDYIIGETPEDLPADLDISEMMERTKVSYPLMQDVISTGFNDDTSKRLFDYVSMLDSTVNLIDVSADTEEAA